MYNQHKGWLFALPVSLILFLSLYGYLLSIKSGSSFVESIDKEINTTKDTGYSLDYTTTESFRLSMKECMEGKARSYSECNSTLNPEIDDKADVSAESAPPEYIIYFILTALWLALYIQLSLFAQSFTANYSFTKTHFHLSDWCINSAPMLGVLGTIASFSMLVSKSDGSDLQVLFNKYFFNAAITTLLGGFVYVLNLLLMVKITSKS